jgi:hypothetical protein
MGRRGPRLHVRRLGLRPQAPHRVRPLDHPQERLPRERPLLELRRVRRRLHRSPKRR